MRPTETWRKELVVLACTVSPADVVLATVELANEVAVPVVNVSELLEQGAPKPPHD